ncbi:MAG: ATP phosphoribosyltransferase [Acidobacteriota bacterium]
MPRIALTKGRILEPALAWLRERGFRLPEVEARSLLLPLGDGWEAVLLKGPDVPVFVQNGAADLGIVGSDILEEEAPDVYDLKALGFGRCRLSLAGPPGRDPRGEGPLRVATKYPRTAERIFRESGEWVRIFRLRSSAELAPLLGLSDLIVDVVDTGRTLRENGLVEKMTLRPVEAHLVANRSSYRFLEDRWWEAAGRRGPEDGGSGPSCIRVPAGPS